MNRILSLLFRKALLSGIAIVAFIVPFLKGPAQEQDQGDFFSSNKSTSDGSLISVAHADIPPVGGGGYGVDGGCCDSGSCSDGC